MSDRFTINQGEIETVVQLTLEIPEFIEPHGAMEYHKRLTNIPHLILIAYVDDQAVGFKVGYEKEGYFYSWMGGILPKFRRIGIAKALANTQEEWARTMGYNTITFKTRNSHKGMLIFAFEKWIRYCWF